MSASWIESTEKENEKVKEQDWEIITVLELKTALTSPRNGNHLGLKKFQTFG